MRNLYPQTLKVFAILITIVLMSFHVNSQNAAFTDMFYSSYNGLTKSIGGGSGTNYESHDMSQITDGYGVTVQMNNTSHYLKIDLLSVDNPIADPGYIQYYLESNSSANTRTLLVQWSADDVTYTTLATHLSENEPVSTPTLYNLTVDPSARYILFDMTERTGSRFELDAIIVSSNPIPASPPGSYAYGNTTYATGVYDVDVKENGITTFNGTAASGYYDYTDQRHNAITITEGLATTLEVDFDTDGAYTVYGKAWIDWNADGDYTDPGEEYDLGSSYNCTCLSSIQADITPAGGTGNASYNMRIAAAYGAYPASSTATGEDAEFEDWILYVAPPVSDFTWTGNVGDGNWSTAGNWDVSLIPSSSSN